MEDIKACNEQPIGNGPYQLAEDWQHNQSISSRRRTDYPVTTAGNADTIDFLMYAT